jgi:hypothetical protein
VTVLVVVLIVLLAGALVYAFTRDYRRDRD